MDNVFGAEIPITFKVLEESCAKFISNFDCNDNPYIQNFIRARALEDCAVTYLFIDRRCQQTIAFASVVCSGIMVPTDTGEQSCFLENEYEIIPAMEVKCFAVNKAYRHIRYTSSSTLEDTLSAYIFNYVLVELSRVAAFHIGTEKIILYAVPRAKSFYYRRGFKPFEQNMTGTAERSLQACHPMYYNLRSY